MSTNPSSVNRIGETDPPPYQTRTSNRSSSAKNLFSNRLTESNDDWWHSIKRTFFRSHPLSSINFSNTISPLERFRQAITTRAAGTTEMSQHLDAGILFYCPDHFQVSQLKVAPKKFSTRSGSVLLSSYWTKNLEWKPVHFCLFAPECTFSIWKKICQHR